MVRSRRKIVASKLIPEKLRGLHAGEEVLRAKAIEMIAADARLALHLEMIEHAMDLADLLRKFDTPDEDLKVVQVLGMRMFNAFAAALKLALSGYGQNGAMIVRDILETVFLVDLFRRDRALIRRWRLADRRARMKDFSPVRVREALDKSDGFTTKKRAEIYELFSELAGHPTMKSAWMMRPEKDGDAVIGPFVEQTALDAVVSEKGKLAVQAGELLDVFFPADWVPAAEPRGAFARTKQRWVATFFPKR